MAWWYSLLLTIHILSAITAVGSNLTYGVWAARGTIESQHLAFVLRGIKFIDDRIANPAYGLLLATGVTMWLTTWPLGTRWIISGLILYALVAVLAITMISPALNKEIAAVETQGPTSHEALAYASRVRGVGIFVSVVVLAIVFVMVFKPAF
ncbi:MAG: DUF2269 family protein [Candidatus Dormibacteraeota bacterium]|nr:DUF2269 family protein [Candidatus Dormibacteraeota bacterium]